MAVLISLKAAPGGLLVLLETPPLRMATYSPVVGNCLKMRLVEKEVRIPLILVTWY